MRSIEADLDTRQLRRMRSEDRQLKQLEVQEAKAEKMIGELCRNGKTVYYVWFTNSRYREGTFSELVQFLIRNHYV